LRRVPLLAEASGRIDGADEVDRTVHHVEPEHSGRHARRSNVRRCRGFTKLWDCNGLAVANVYALRSTNPAALWAHHDPVGPDNDNYLWIVARERGAVVCAWGSNAKPQRAARVASILIDAGARLWCLGTTKDGSPRHPLYVRADQPLIRWTPQSAARESAEGGAA
jgi:hypothetical protein